MATGAPGTNGVWQYGEDDSEATFSALLNKVASTTDTQIGTDRGRLTTLEARKLSGLVPIIASTVRISGGTATANSLGKVSFTNATSIGLDNVFSSSYSSYKILLETSSSSYVGTNAIAFRQTSGGTATSGSLFYGGRAYINVSAFGANDFTNGSPNYLITDIIYSGYNALGTSTELTYTKTASGVRLSLAASAFAGTTAGFMWGGATWNEASSNYDGFRLSLASSGTFSGKISVYGLDS